MELQGERLIPATIDATWAALNDPEVLKACIAGCESLERTGGDAYTALVAVKVGPVGARFKGNLKLTDIEPPKRYAIHFDGQGGVAGFGKGSADVSLTPEGEQTRLAYAAKAQVGGKLAQVGSRLIDAAAGKIAGDFFKAFEEHLSSKASRDAAASADAAAREAADAPDVPAGSTGAARADDKLWWLAGAVAVAVPLYLLWR